MSRLPMDLSPEELRKCLPEKSAKMFHELRIQMMAEEFQKTGNPVLVIEAFLLASRANVDVSSIQYNALIGWFQQWYDNQSKVSLDKIMGLTLPRGKTPPYKTLLLGDRNEMLFQKVAILKTLGVDTYRAAEMACRGFEKFKDWNKSRWKLKTIDADTIAREYSKWPPRKELEEIYGELVLKWSLAETRNFLSQFPSDSIPYPLKNTLTKSSAHLKPKAQKS